MPKSKSAYSIPSKKQKTDTYIFVVWVDNEAGVLARVVGLFSGRGYNIESLAVAEVDAVKNISRITIVTTGTPQVIDQIKLQEKFIYNCRGCFSQQLRSLHRRSFWDCIKISYTRKKIATKQK